MPLCEKRILNIMKDWKKEANLSMPIMYKVRTDDDENVTLTICTSSSSALLGFKNRIVDKYKGLIKHALLTNGDIHIEFVEVGGYVL